MKLPLPFTEKTFARLELFLKDVISKNESGSVIGLNHKEQSYRIDQLTKKLLLGIKIIDLKNYLIDDPEDLQININTKGSTTIFITNADCLLDEKRYFLTYFNNLVRKNGKLSLIFFFQHNITYSWHTKILSSYQYIFQNILFYPKYKDTDLRQFILYLENKFDLKIPKQVSDSIIKNCEGNFWFIKEAVRYYVKTKDIKKIFNHEEMIFRLKAMYDELEDIEKQVLDKVIKKTSALTDEEIYVSKYLETSNYIAPLLKKYILEKTIVNQILCLDKDKRIILNSVPMDSFFSRSERIGLRHFISHPNKIITRNELAKVLWNAYQDYTDWALDQFIKRLRNKLVKLGLSKSLLKTIKNQGFIFYLNK